MLNSGNALKVAIYVSEGTTSHGVPSYSSIIDFLSYRGISGVTVLKAIAGFGADHHMRTSSYVEISAPLPIKVEFTESPEKVNELIGNLEEIAGGGMIEIQQTTATKPAQASSPANLIVGGRARTEGAAKLMRIYIDEADRWKGKPLYIALVEAMQANDIDGVTVCGGILEYGVHRHAHEGNLSHLAHNAAITLTVIEREGKLRSFLTIVEQMLVEGLVVLSDVDIIKYSRRATEGELPDARFAVKDNSTEAEAF